MNAFLSLGRWLFAIPFTLFGLLHFMNAEAMAAQVVPEYLPAKMVWVYLSGAGLIAAAVSMLTGKFDKLATILLAVFLILMVLLVHMPGAMHAQNELLKTVSMSNLMKDLSLAGGCMMYAKYLGQDRSVVG